MNAFVKNCDTFVAVKSLPDIFFLIKLLSDTFHTQFTRKDAKEILIKDFLESHMSDFNLSQQRLDDLVQSFVKAWNIALSSSDCKFLHQKLSSSIVFDLVLVSFCFDVEFFNENLV